MRTRKVGLIGVVVTVIVVIVFLLRSSEVKPPSMAPDVPATQGGFAEWGWPLPHEKVSDKSIDWLKEKGWWPLTLGYFTDLTGYSVHFAVMKELDLLGKRGIQSRFISFLSGPPIVEAFISGQTQVTHYGDFPYWSTVDKGNPATAYSITGVNNEAAILVPPGSSFQRVEDFKGRDKPIVIGTTLGSYCEFYISAMADVKGLTFGNDYKFAGMSMREAQLLPKGVDAVALWDPHITFSISKGLGRKIDTVFPYYFATAFEFVRTEIHENAPDVVQALSDALVEAVLYIRYNPSQAAEWYHSDPRIRAYPRELITEQTTKYFLLYKPTYKFLHADFWAEEDERVAISQYNKNRLTHRFTRDDLRSNFAPEYMEKTFEKLGFRIPDQPVFIPSKWSGDVGRPPYPEYWNAGTLPRPQPFPEEGDLTKDWFFNGKHYKAQK